MRFDNWQPYVPVAARRAEARRQMLKLRSGGFDVQPIEIEGRKIAKSFWGAAWCDHLESFGDFANRIPRGRTYVRNGSVCHLAIERGEVKAMVSGSQIYNVSINIAALAAKRWTQVKGDCTGQISSVLELLQGRLSAAVMAIVTDQKNGLFPAPEEINFSCDCPDYARMCKHIAAVLYGVGARLDHQPELLFTLRGVDHQELVSADIAVADATPEKGGRRRIATDALADVFGIELTEDTPAPRKPASKSKRPKQKSARKSAKKTAKKTGRPSAKKATKKAAKKAVPKSRMSPGLFTGDAVAALRKKFAMTRPEFGRLAGVSAVTVRNWEANSGTLKLRTNSQGILKHLARLTRRKAWKEMEQQ